MQEFLGQKLVRKRSKKRAAAMPLPNPIYGNVEPMQLDLPMEEGGEGFSDAIPITTPNSESSSDSPVPNYVVENPTLDIEAYAASYHGLAKIQRLVYIADHCPPMAIDSLKLAIAYIKTDTYNTQMYTKLHTKLVELSKGLPADQQPGPIDQAYVEQRAKRAAMKLEKLDNELKNYKSNSLKESIRRGHDELGDHYLAMGDLNSALKCYVRSRDYCINSKQVLSMCLNAIRVSIHLRNWPFVSTNVSRAEHNPDFQANRTIVTKINCAAGLAHLSNHKFEAAAKSFLACNFDDFTNDATDILSANNVAIYGGLCALATFDRVKLQKMVISSSSFKLFLESEPQLREAITRFYQSKYASCLSILKEMKDNLLLDMYIARHVKSLYEQIRNRALVQYFSPYTSADLKKMAAAFNTSVKALEDEIMQLILDGQIQARIDSHNKILYAKDVDQRTVTFQKALEMGKEWRKRTRALILRSAILKNPQIHVKGPPLALEESQNNLQSTV